MIKKILIATVVAIGVAVAPIASIAYAADLPDHHHHHHHYHHHHHHHYHYHHHHHHYY